MRSAANSAELVEAVRERCGVEHRGHPRRGGGAARVPRRDLGAGRRPRLARRLRHRRRQLAVHVRPGGKVDERSASTSAPCGYTERFGLDGAVSDDGLAEALERDRRRPRAARRPPAPGSARRDGRRGHQPRRRAATASPTYDPASSRARSSTGPRSTARSSSTGRAPPTSGARSSACSRQARRGDPRGRLHRPHRPRQARCDELTVSDRGLRHGLLAERFGGRELAGRRRLAGPNACATTRRATR